mgnify:CR=1 FL=1
MKDKVFIIAEAGVNHNGNIDLAYQLIEIAKKTGADCVKFQTFKAEHAVSTVAKMADYQKRNIGKEESQFEMIKKLELKFSDFGKLKEYCDRLGIIFLSTPFDFESVDFLENLVPYYKIPSGEITNIPYLKHVARKNKPLIMSTGMANLGEVETAIDTVKKESPDIEIHLLHCTTNYPTPFEEVNLKAMITLKDAFKLPVGYSDHTLGIEIPISAVALGARIIEKHFTLDRNLPGPDHKASVEPEELKEMVKCIRNVECALGDGIKKPNESERRIMGVARKSIVAKRLISQGEAISHENVTVKRPGNGLPPSTLELLIGKKVRRTIEKDELLGWSDFMETADEGTKGTKV